MTTPTRSEIVEKAKELYIANEWKNGNIDPNNPEYEELSESGYIAEAKSMLMTDMNRAMVESDFVGDIPEDFKVDLQELYEGNALVLGSRHSGKSDVAMMICERAMKENTIIVCFDPSLDWIQRSSISQYMKVKPDTDLSIPNESMIYDVSLLSPNQQQKIVERFSKELFESQAQTKNRKQYLIVFEEAHTYFYQGSMRSKKCQNSVRLLSVGRNVDVCCLLISQFASMLDKFTIKHSMSQAYFGYTREPNDLKYLRKILGDKAKELTKLEDGQFLYLNRNRISKIGINPYRNSTPKTEIKSKLIEPIKAIPKKRETDTLKTLSTLILGVLWLVAMIIGVKG